MTAAGVGDDWSHWPAPAKLNLFLHIIGRRDDGYHLLQTVFQLLDWGDAIHLRLRSDGVIRRSSALQGVAEADDLTVRAAHRLRRHAGCPDAGVEIAVDKRIPLGGGLGGGSSDAATVLVALNRLWGCGLGVDELALLGLSLGADVPVFVHGHSAFAEGIGERLTPLPIAPARYLLVDPGVSVPTRELFDAPELTRDAPAMTIRGFVRGDPTGNAFEPVVRARYPAVERVFDWLGRHGRPRLSGSGGAVFMPITGDVAELLAECPAGMRAWTAHGVDRSPLLRALAARGDGM